MLNLNRHLESTLRWPEITAAELSTLLLLLFFIILSVFEAHFPKMDCNRSLRGPSYRTNISLFLINSAVVPVVTATSLWILSDHYGNRGLLSYFQNPIAQAILAFLALDLMLYLWHRASHHFDYLWMFHRVHHSDMQMNVSTAFRVHIVELLLTHVFKSVYIIVLGVDKIMLITEETVMTFFVMLHHGNFSLPGENLLKKVIIVPSLHRVHHSAERREHDRNYGSALSLWDRIFGTLAELEPKTIGIKHNPPQDVISQLKLGFTPVAAVSPMAEPLAQNRFPAAPDIQAMVAEAAYYKALHRGFEPGHEMADWLEAETEILKRIHAGTPKTKPSTNPIMLQSRLGTLNC